MCRIACAITAQLVVLTGIVAAEKDSPLADGRHEEPDPIPRGQLGFPIGTYLTIEGVRSEADKAGTQTLVIHAVNGKRLTRETAIWIDNVELPTKAQCQLKGYETAKWIGIPPDVIDAGAVRVSPSSHPPWHLFRYFVATSIESPKQAKLKYKP